MKRETRANLIFITIFLLVAIPGVFKLTMKAYNSGGRDPAMRRPVRGEWAYMDPTPQVRDLPRVVPPGIGRFVWRTADRLERMQPGYRSIVPPDGAMPVMSERLGLQLLGTGSSGGSFHLGLLAWNSKYAPLPTQFTIVGQRGGVEVEGKLTAYEPMNLPVELRMDLQETGYIVPPDSLMWMIVSFAGDQPIDSMRSHFTLDATVIDDELKLPRMSMANPTTNPSTP
jgi:hypothetical protein